MKLDDLKALLTSAGGTDLSYLEHHWPRFCQTKSEILLTRPLSHGSAVLDVGAHWLHQAALYAFDGHRVHALDLPQTMDLPQVRKAAAELGISIHCNKDLENIESLAGIENDFFDLILFTEIIEHITFNPVAMWKEIFRVAKPGGRIVVTTPNYYAARGRLWDCRRFLTNFGGGIDVYEILSLHTYAHHWKEYSLRELIKYFTLLSEDFNCIKAKYVHEYHHGYLGVGQTRLTRFLEDRIPYLRPCLHVEVDVGTKSAGIRIAPHW